MASPTVKRVVRTTGWTVVGFLVTGLLTSIVFDILDVNDEDSPGALVGTGVSLCGAVVAAMYGWRHDPYRRKRSSADAG